MSPGELKAEIRELGGGTRREMAEALGVDPGGGSFKRALAELVDEGVFEARGSTTDRFYVLAGSEPEEPAADPVGDALWAAVPCSAHEFSDVGHGLGLFGAELMRAKVAAGIETVKGEDGRWHCRLKVEGEARLRADGAVAPSRIASGFGVAVDLKIHRSVARSEAFARMSPVAGEDGRIIGSGRP